MNLPSQQTEPSYFGKDTYVPFIGQVEDVDDPKRSGRVKVRCLGWHPAEKTGENGLQTEDLPWARTLMPTTHAQQMRVGGKHGLMPGSMVTGFFLDGFDANDPIVIGAFNHTAKASEENNREKVETGSGQLPTDKKGFIKVDVLSTSTSGTHTEQEKINGSDDPGDVGHDSSSLDDSIDGECPIERSAFTTTKERELKASNPHSQFFNVPIADGLCGALMNGRGKIADEINKLLPDGVGSIVEGSDLYDVNGNIINVNAILKRLSGLIASQLRFTINENKGFIQKTMNRKAHSLGIFAGATRSPLTAPLADQGLSVKFDTLNSVIDIFVSSLDKIVYQSIQNLYQQKLSSKIFDNLTGEGGTSGSSSIFDVSAIELTDSILTDVELSYGKVDAAANEVIESKTSGLSSKIAEFDSKASNAKVEDYEGEDSMREDLESSQKEISDEIKSISDQSDDVLQAVNDSLDKLLDIPSSLGFELSDVSQVLGGVLDMDFTTNMALFNKVGPMVLDMFTQSGCSPVDMFNTFEGFVGSKAGVDGQYDGGGSESGKSSKKDKDIYSNSGFAGKPGKSTFEDSTNVIKEGESSVQKIGEGTRRRIRQESPSFTPVDYYEVGRRYDLNGETTINGKTTRRSRVLVNNQSDASENGIYITSVSEWQRSDDANRPTDFIRKKKVRVRSLDKKEGFFYYSGKQRAKVGFDDIEFLNLFESDEFTDKEKNAFDDSVEIIPDGSNGSFFLASRPSSNIYAAQNYVDGIPNVAVITRTGRDYFYTSKKPGRNFPSIAIQGYQGTPRPVVDPGSGELVAVLINYNSFDSNNSNPSTSVFADDSSKGVSSADPNYDVFLSGIYIVNTGAGYSKETEIEIIDRDTNDQGAQVRPKIRKGRITAIEVINTGEGFKRIPKVRIKNAGKGTGLKIYPMMGLRPKNDVPSVRKLQDQVSLNLAT